MTQSASGASERTSPAPGTASVDSASRSASMALARRLANQRRPANTHTGTKTNAISSHPPWCPSTPAVSATPQCYDTAS